jgi:hypothetical protein
MGARKTSSNSKSSDSCLKTASLIERTRELEEQLDDNDREDDDE